MADIYMYADETGDLDWSGSPKASSYFGFGTAVFVGAHGKEMWEGMQLRCSLERRGVRVPRGLHAVYDSHATRSEVYALVQAQAPRIDTTFLAKTNAYPSVKAKGPMYLYKMAWFLHFKEIARQVTSPADTLYVIAATLGTHKRASQAHAALADVCAQSALGRSIVLCQWDASSSWGVQVADYALWAVQRDLEGRASPWLASCVQPTLHSKFLPWGMA